MSERAFGVIVPSSNRVVERTTEKVLAYFPDVAACYSRIPLHGNGKGQPVDGYDVPSLDGALESLGVPATHRLRAPDPDEQVPDGLR